MFISHTRSTGFLVFTALILLLSVSIFGQRNQTSQDLRKSFKSFELVRMDDQNLRSEGGMRITTSTASYDLLLYPRDLRPRRYRAEDTNADRSRVLGREPVDTFMGTIRGENGSAVRMTIKDGAAEGYFVSRGERYFVEPAARYSKNADSRDLVIYRSGDHLDEHGFFCKTEFEEALKKGKEIAVPPSRSDLVGPGVLEIATEADFQYVNALGGASQANNEILSVLNMVEGVYQQELNLSIQVVFQHTWSTADPFSATNANTLLDSFISYWNSNYPTAQYPRDAAHLFSGKSAVLSMGLAYVGTVCRNPSFAYGLSGYISWAPGKYLVTAHELGHNLDANHADAPQGCANTIMNPVLSGATPMTFCPFSRTEIGNHVTTDGDCLAPPPADSAASFDFDGDLKSDVSVWRPLNGVWYISRSGDSGFDSISFGQNGDRPVAADFDGDGKTDPAVYRNGVWYVLNSSTNTFSGVPFGINTDIPVPADVDGDGKADYVVFRPETGIWHALRSSDGGYFAVMFGMVGDIPLPADYDGDGKADINVWRPSNGAWYRLNSSNGGFWATIFGQTGDLPLKGDFDGDSMTDLAIYRPSTGFWFVYKSSDSSFFGAPFGASDDLPTPGDFDGDGKTDIAVFRPQTGIWYRLNSSNGAVNYTSFGTAGDMPTPANFIP